MTTRPDRRPEPAKAAGALSGKPRVRKLRLRPGQPLGDGLSTRADPEPDLANPAPAGDARTPLSGSGEDSGGGQDRRLGESLDGSSIHRLGTIPVEALTPRQLRAARRVAQRHGLLVFSDHEAVHKLRRRGIDPFRSPSLLARVPADAFEPSADPESSPPDALRTSSDLERRPEARRCSRARPAARLSSPRPTCRPPATTRPSPAGRPRSSASSATSPAAGGASSRCSWRGSRCW